MYQLQKTAHSLLRTRDGTVMDRTQLCFRYELYVLFLTVCMLYVGIM